MIGDWMNPDVLRLDWLREYHSHVCVSVEVCRICLLNTRKRSEINYHVYDGIEGFFGTQSGIWNGLS